MEHRMGHYEQLTCAEALAEQYAEQLMNADVPAAYILHSLDVVLYRLAHSIKDVDQSRLLNDARVSLAALNV